MLSEDIPLGYSIIGKSKIIDLHITKAILKYRNPYHKLVILLFQFAKLNNNLKNTNQISLNDVEYYFGLQKEHAKEVLKSLVKDGFLRESQESVKEGDKGVDHAYFLNDSVIINLYEDPYKEITKDIDYYFSLFPRLFIPEYLFGFKEIKVSKDLLTLIPELDIKNISTSANRKMLKIPEQFLGISDMGMQSHIEMKKSINIRLVPQTKNGDFKCSLAKISRLKWAEKDRIIEDGHPDYDLIKNWLGEIDIEKLIENKLPPQNRDLKYHLEYNDEDFAQIIIIDKIIEKKTDGFLKKLEYLQFRFDLRNTISEITIKLSENNTCHQDLENLAVKCRIQIVLPEKFAFSFFAEYLSRLIFNFQIKYNQIIPLIEKNYEKFLDFFNLKEKLFPLPSIDQLKQYYWDVEKYRMAYLLMYGGDLL